VRLADATIDSVAMVDSPASRIRWSRVSKVNDGYDITSYVPFTYIIEKANGVDVVRVSGVAYPCDKIDSQGDFAKREDVVQMEKSFRLNRQVINYMHRYDLRPDQASATASTIDASGNWQLSAIIHDPTICAEIRSGKLTAWSIQGRVPAPTSAPTTKNQQETNMYATKSELAEWERTLEMARELSALVAQIPDGAQLSARAQAAQDEIVLARVEAAVAEHLAEMARAQRLQELDDRQQEAVELGLSMFPAEAERQRELNERVAERQQYLRRERRLNAQREEARERRGL
jgi:hypothetical protein